MNIAIRWEIFSGCFQNPARPDASARIPIVAARSAWMTAKAVNSPPIGANKQSAGRYTNMKGKVNPTKANRNAANEVFIIGASAIEALA